MGQLILENISVSYGEKKVITKFSLDVDAGEILVVLGESGDGKTTLLKTIAGLLPKSSGTITFENEKIKGPDEQLVPGHPLIKLVNQDFSLDEFHTVEENIRLRLLSFDRDYQQARITSLLRLTKLSSYKNKQAKELSGGQRQRLAIARALADEPEFILLDEPFNQLDYQTKHKIEKHIKHYLRKNGIGAIMVTHNGQEALEWADRIVYMEKGKLKRSGLPKDFYNTPLNYKEASFFGPLNKVSLNAKELYFRPSDFSTTKTEEFNTKFAVKFESFQFVGWYGKYNFVMETNESDKGKKSKIELYSTVDISTVTEIFIKKTSFID